VLLGTFLHGNLIQADEFQITLQIQQDKHKAEATSKLPASEQTKADANKKQIIRPRLKRNEREKPRSRPVLHVQANRTVWVRWQVTKSKSLGTFQDVMVYVFAVQEAKVGQQKVPKLSDRVAYESALTMDFTPKDQAQGRFQLKFERAGSYLVRAETIRLIGRLGHEFHAAIDVVVDDTVTPKS